MQRWIMNLNQGSPDEISRSRIHSNLELWANTVIRIDYGCYNKPYKNVIAELIKSFRGKCKVLKRIVILSWSSYKFNLNFSHLFSLRHVLRFNSFWDIPPSYSRYFTRVTVVSRPVHGLVSNKLLPAANQLPSWFYLYPIKKSHVFLLRTLNLAERWNR